jgi:hypothetical protein
MRLVVNSACLNDFRDKFFELFGTMYDPTTVMSRIYRMYALRDRFREDLAKIDEQNRTVLIPAVIKHKNAEAPIHSGVRSHHDDDDEVTMLKKQHTLLAEILQLSKERLKVEQEMRDIAKAQLEFFGGLKKKVEGE